MQTMGCVGKGQVTDDVRLGGLRFDLSSASGHLDLARNFDPLPLKPGFRSQRP